MPVYTSQAYADPYSQDDIPASAASVRAATVDEAISNMLTPSIFRAIELDRARAVTRFMPRERQYDAAAAESFMAENGLAGQFKFEDRPYNQLELSILARRKQEELKRQAILARADQSFGAQAGRLGLTLAASLMDPLTVATAFVPVVREARYSALLARAGGAFGRAGVRAAVGAAEGIAGTALVEPIIYGAKVQEQADYDLADSLLNIAVGGVFGGGLHAGGGALLDLGTAARRRRIEERSAEISRILAQREELERPAPFTPLVETERVLRTQELESSIEGLFKRRRADLEQASAGKLSRTGEVALREEWEEARRLAREINDSVDPEGAAAADQRLADVTARLRNHEMAELAADELRRLDSAWNRAKNVQDRAALFKGEDAAIWRELASAEHADNLDAVQARIAKLESERPDAEAALRTAEQQKARAAQTKLADTQAGLADRDLREAHRRLRAIDGELTQLRRIGGELTEKLKDASRVRVLKADPAVREAALGAAVAQAVSERPIDVNPVYERTNLRSAVERQSDPDSRPLSDPDSVRRADDLLAQGESDDLAYVQNQLAETEAELKALQNELEEDLPADVREEIEAAAAAATEAQEMSKAAELLVACAMRHA